MGLESIPRSCRYSSTSPHGHLVIRDRNPYFFIERSDQGKGARSLKLLRGRDYTRVEIEDLSCCPMKRNVELAFEVMATERGSFGDYSKHGGGFERETDGFRFHNIICPLFSHIGQIKHIIWDSMQQHS